MNKILFLLVVLVISSFHLIAQSDVEELIMNEQAETLHIPGLSKANFKKLSGEENLVENGGHYMLDSKGDMSYTGNNAIIVLQDNSKLYLMGNNNIIVIGENANASVIGNKNSIYILDGGTLNLTGNSNSISREKNTNVSSMGLENTNDEFENIESGL